MPRNSHKIPIDLKINNLKRIYAPVIEKMNPKPDIEHVVNFFNFVIPALAEPKVLKDISLNPRYLCLFSDCKEQNKTYSSKQKYVQHLKIFHDQELPEGGSFISPNDKSTQPGGFWCSVCGHHYCRRDHLLNHFKTSLHCQNADVLTKNPLELKDIEYEKKLAIEDGKVENKNGHMVPDLKAICWKETNLNDEFNYTDEDLTINILKNSFSLMSINSEKPAQCRRSSTIYTFHSKNFIHKRSKRKNDSEEKIHSKKTKEINHSSEDEEVLNALISYENSKNLFK